MPEMPQTLEAVPRPSNPCTHRLTVAQVRRIRRLWATTNLSQREIGERVGCHQVTVSQIVRGVTWKDR